MEELSYLFLGGAIQAGVSALLSWLGMIKISPFQQAVASVIFLMIVIIIWE